MIFMWLILGIVATGGAYVLATGVHRVPPEHIGVVYRRFGRMHPEDRRFQLVRAHGSPGIQAETLTPDRFHFRPRPLFKVDNVKLTYVPPGTIGVVVAKDGAPPSVASALGKHVECDNFENGQKFLREGGQRGRQLGILPGAASYAINTKLFDVITVATIGEGRDDLTADDLREITVSAENTGVVVVYAGQRADQDELTLGRIVPGHGSFQLPWVFLDNGGQQGVQEETLSRGGIYRINPWFARILLVPTRVIVLEWKRSDQKPDDNFDKTLDQIRINVEGHWLRFDMTQTIRIPARAAPHLVSQFGDRKTDTPHGSASVKRFVNRFLGPLVEGYFQRAADKAQVLAFVSAATEVRTDLAARVAEALQPLGIEAFDTALGEFEPEEKTLDEFRRQLARQRDRRRELEHQQENTEIEEQIKERQLDTERKRRRLEVVELQAQIELLGADNIAMERFITQLVKAKVPEVVAGNAESLLGYMSLPIARDMIAKAFHRVDTRRDYPQPIDGPAPRQENSVSSHRATIYTSSDDGTELNRTLIDVLGYFGLELTELVVDVPPVFGAWLQCGRVKIAGGSEFEPIRKRVRELQTALRLHATGRAGAEIAETQAVQAFLDALNRHESVTIRLGSLIVVKSDDQMAAWAVSEQEAAEFEENQGFLTNPAEVCERMKSFGNSFIIQP